MAVTYYALLTTVGASKLANAAALGTALKITQLAVGDGNGSVPTPDASRTSLIREVRRAPLNRLSIDPANASQIIAEQVIPESVGGWWIREIGLYDDAGSLVAIANCAPSYKPLLAEGSGRTQTVRMILIVNNTGTVELKIDPSVVLATREYVDSAITAAVNRQDFKQSVRVATTGNITLSNVQTIDGVALAIGDRVLVKSQTTASQNGIYTVAADSWIRSDDADENGEVTPGLTVPVESGTQNADTIWLLVTDAPIVIGTTALTFQDITNGLARLQSPAFTGAPTAPTAAQFDNDTSLATTEFVQRAVGNIAGYALLNGVSSVITADMAGKLVVLNASAGTAISVALPATADLPIGATFHVAISNNGANCTFTPSDGKPIAIGSAVAVASATVKGATDGYLMWRGDIWCLHGGSITLPFEPQFAVLSTANGYQKLPSGLVIQWGSVASIAAGSSATVTLPIAMPNAVLKVVANVESSVNNTTPVSAAWSTINAAVFSLRNLSTQVGAFSWIAIGH